MGKQRVLLGFSGGVDSCASAAILLRSGFEVMPVILDATGDKGLIKAAGEAAGRLGLDLRVADVRNLFKEKIIYYFVDGYRRGETPAPCTVCNPAIKWRTLYEIAQAEEGYDHIATGHYFRVHCEKGKYYVCRGIDPVKDQSYYLWALPQEYLRKALTPMGDRIKSDIKEKYGEYTPARESMGVCFLQGQNYAEFLHRQGIPIVPGDIVDKDGNVIGSHEGYPLYTTGQKRGLNIFGSTAGAATAGCGELRRVPAASGGPDGAGAEAMVVTGIDAAGNRIEVGGDEQLYHTNLLVDGVVAADLERLLRSEMVTVKIRGLGRNLAGYARIRPERQAALNTECLRVALDSPAWACAKGQPVVFYEGDLVLGGGFLRKYW